MVIKIVVEFIEISDFINNTNEKEIKVEKKAIHVESNVLYLIDFTKSFSTFCLTVIRKSKKQAEIIKLAPKKLDDWVNKINEVINDIKAPIKRNICHLKLYNFIFCIF